uniref:Uncharacterized protein LOC114326970 n=1 Tax=Diabrotica virgifera virgifera TaxID=50390 RepID=A0A6P7FCZ8_DIAVI
MSPCSLLFKYTSVVVCIICSRRLAKVRCRKFAINITARGEYKMNKRNYWTKPLTLNELLDEIEHLDDPVSLTDGIIVFPPSDKYNTDEDSGDENHIDINNLPGSQ